MLAMPGQVTRFVMRLAPQEKEVNSLTPWYPFDPAALGLSYVWHCHIIDHEDNEMMRRLGVTPYAPAPVRSFVQGVDY